MKQNKFRKIDNALGMCYNSSGMHSKYFLYKEG